MTIPFCGFLLRIRKLSLEILQEILLIYHWLELDYVAHEIIPRKGTEMTLRPIGPTTGAGSAYLEACGYMGDGFC